VTIGHYGNVQQHRLGRNVVLDSLSPLNPFPNISRLFNPLPQRLT
jgi:hypothetical protein